MNAFIRVIEYWVPTADKSLLEFGGAMFGNANRFAAATRSLCFGKGEGLPGQAWEQGRPIVLRQLGDSYFRRAKAAEADGLTCGIALPLYKGTALTAVVVIFCGDDAQSAGAIELWRNDPQENTDLSLADGYYGLTGDAFEFISRSIIFRRGSGLPGIAWEKQAPVFLENLGKGSGFLRADGAVKVGINRGFAIPCAAQDGSNVVMAFLSALATPIAQQVEVWEPASHPTDTENPAIECTFCFAEAMPESQTIHYQVRSHGARALIEQAFASGVPAVHAPMIAIPVAPQGKVTAVMALYF